MRDLSAGELVRLRGTQESSMFDTCRVMACSTTADDYGNPTRSYAAGSATSCGVELVNPDEWHASGELPVIDAKIRLPIDTDLNEDDRIRVTHRHDEALSEAQDYEVEGPVKRGPSGLVVACRLVV